jgi:hypothetical protein
VIKTRPVSASTPASKRNGPCGRNVAKTNGGEGGVGKVDIIRSRARKLTFQRAESRANGHEIGNGKQCHLDRVGNESDQHAIAKT